VRALVFVGGRLHDQERALAKTARRGTRGSRVNLGLHAMEEALGKESLSVLHFRVLSTANGNGTKLAQSWHPRCHRILETFSAGAGWEQQADCADRASSRKEKAVPRPSKQAH
jgi:hypothetical protein